MKIQEINIGQKIKFKNEFCDSIIGIVVQKGNSVFAVRVPETGTTWRVEAKEIISTIETVTVDKEIPIELPSKIEFVFNCVAAEIDYEKIGVIRSAQMRGHSMVGNPVDGFRFEDNIVLPFPPKDFKISPGKDFKVTIEQMNESK